MMSFRVDTWEGELLRVTDETVDAGFFPLDALPRPEVVVDTTRPGGSRVVRAHRAAGPEMTGRGTVGWRST